eukprot:Awhi_evm1s15575
MMSIFIFFSCLSCCLALSIPTNTKLNRLVAFGDSLSDSQGRTNHATVSFTKVYTASIDENELPNCSHDDPDNYGYSSYLYFCDNADGRYAEGKVWTEYLSKKWNLEEISYAYGGSTTNNSFVRHAYPEPINIPDLAGQYAEMVGDGYTIDQGDMIAIFSGANDLFNSFAALLGGTEAEVQEFLTKLATNIVTFAKLLISKGAKHIAIFNTVPFDTFPVTVSISNGNEAIMNRISQTHDALSYILSLAVNQLSDVVNGYGVSVQLVDTSSLYQKVYKSFDYIPGSSPFGCLSPVVYSNVEDRFSWRTDDLSSCQKSAFFDDTHFTTNAHKKFSQQLSKDLKSQFSIIGKYNCQKIDQRATDDWCGVNCLRDGKPNGHPACLLHGFRRKHWHSCKCNVDLYV